MKSVLLLFLATTACFLNSFGQTPGDSTIKIVKSTPFQMSKESEIAGIDGALVLSIEVDKTGKVKKAEIVAGPAWPCGTEPKGELSDVRRGVKENVLSSVFSPAMKDGKPQSSDLYINFVIGEAYQAELRKREREEALRRGEEPPRVVKGGVLNGKALRLPRPEYPFVARSQRLSGSASIQVLIDEKGDVVRAGSVSGHPALQESARTAACSAKFAPTLLDGKPVRVNGVITYNFVP